MPIRTPCAPTARAPTALALIAPPGDRPGGPRRRPRPGRPRDPCRGCARPGRGRPDGARRRRRGLRARAPARAGAHLGDPRAQPLRRAAALPRRVGAGPRAGAALARRAARRRGADRPHRRPADRPLAGRLDRRRARGGRDPRGGRPRRRVDSRAGGVQHPGPRLRPALHRRRRRGGPVPRVDRRPRRRPRRRPGRRRARARRPRGARLPRARAARRADRPRGLRGRAPLSPARRVGLHRRRQPVVDPRPRDGPPPARGRRRAGPRLRGQRLELPHHGPLARLRPRHRAPSGRCPLRHRHQSQRRGPRAGQRLVQPARPRARRGAHGADRRPGGRTRSCGSSGPASPTAPATAARPPASGGPRARWRSPAPRRASPRGSGESGPVRG